MRGEPLASPWRVLPTIKSPSRGATVAEVAAQGGCHTRTTWRDLAAIQEAGFPLCSQKDGDKSRCPFVEGRPRGVDKPHIPAI